MDSRHRCLNARRKGESDADCRAWRRPGAAVAGRAAHARAGRGRDPGQDSSCGHCDYCVRGDQILCPQKKITGIGVDGGYGEYLAAAHGILPEVTAVSLDRAPDILAAMAAGTARGRSVITF
jgi:hypothetical protein